MPDLSATPGRTATGTPTGAVMTVLGLSHYALGALTAGGGVLLLVVGLLLYRDIDQHGNEPLAGLALFLAGVAAVLLGAVALPAGVLLFAAGWGMAHDRAWGRVLAAIFAVLALCLACFCFANNGPVAGGILVAYGLLTLAGLIGYWRSAAPPGRGYGP